MSRSASQTPNLTRKNISKVNQGVVGAVDEDVFYSHFSSIETREVSHNRELQEIIGEIIAALKGHSEDWEKRVRGLKTLQSIVLSASNIDEFVSPYLRQLQVPLQSCLTDLRSQVVREACLTVAYLAHVLKIRVEQTTDALIPYVIGLIPNSARVMSTSGIVCLSIIITNIHSPKILLHILSAMNSKSNSTRRVASKLLETICNSWDSTILEKQLSNLQVALEKGTADADQEARAQTRGAFVGFVLSFPQEANKMLMLMDSGRRNLLEKELANHPAGEILAQFSNSTKPRSNNPPNTLKLGTSSYASKTYKKSSVSDSGDESGPSGRSKSNYSSLNRPRNRSQTDRSNNLMTSSVCKTSESSNLRGSNSSLSGSGYGYKSSARVTPQTTRRTSNPTNGSANNNGSGQARNESQSSYRYKSSGSASASLPRRKNFSSGNKGGLYSGFENGLEPPSSGMISRKRLDSSDDNGSETSSIESSEVSKSSLRAMKPTENVQEMMRQLTSAHWSDKKDGLINFQNLIQSRRLNTNDLKRFIEIFNTLFNDTKSKIFPLFLTCIQQLVENHKQYLYDWLYHLLLNLVSKQASETMMSRQKIIQDTLGTIRSNFPFEVLIRDCCRLIIDSYQNTSMKFKLSIMNFFKTVLIVAPTSVMEQSLSSLTPTVNIIIEWVFESKWQEIRKISTALVLKLHTLHGQVLESILSCLPPITRQKTINLIKSSADGAGDSNLRLKLRETIPRSNSFHDKNPDKGGDQYGYYGHQTAVRQRDTYGNRNRPQVKMGTGVSSSSSMTQEDIDNYIRRNTEDLQALAVAYEHGYDGVDGNRSYSRNRPYNTPLRSQLSDPAYGENGQNGNHINQNMLNNPVASYMINRFQSSLRNANYSSSSISSSSDMLGGGPVDPYGAGSNNSNQRNMMPSMDNGGLAYSCYPTYDAAAYNYYPISDAGSAISDQMYMGAISSDAYLQSQSPIGFQMLKKISDLPPDDMIMTILAELCYLNQRVEQRKACLMKLINLVRENSVENWNEVFKTTLMRLLDTVKDTDPEIRTLSLRVLQELTKTMPHRFDDFTHLTVLKILHCHKDSDKTVVRAAEECSQSMAKGLSQNLCIKVLSEVLNENDCRMNLGALKMLLEVLKSVPEPLLVSSLDGMVPGLIRTSEHDESHIRKASIFCLVEINRRIGDLIWSHLSALSSSKTRLLRLYIEKNNSYSRMTESNIAS